MLWVNWLQPVTLGGGETSNVGGICLKLFERTPKRYRSKILFCRRGLKVFFTPERYQYLKQHILLKGTAKTPTIRGAKTAF